MKTFKYFLFAFIAAFMGVGCSDDPTYTPGEGEDPNSYGVYFPTQENGRDVELDPTDPTVLEFKAMRKNFKDAIIVPVEVISSEAGLFTASEIKFEAGQQETTFDVQFDNAEIGKTYKCSLRITDNRFANVYGSNPTGLDFSVTRVQWNLVKGPNGETKGRWRDEFLTDIMGGNIKENGQPNAEKEVEIYERGDMPGYYRIKDIYDEAYIRKICGTMYSNFVLLTDTYTIIDATNKDKVWLPAQSAGYILNEYFGDSDGDMMYVSYCKENFPDKADATRYGTNDNGVITFPNKAIMYTAGSIDWQSGLMYTSNTSITRILLPGAQERDYSVAFTSAPPADGKVVITATLGADVAKVKYAYFEGELGTSLIASKAADIGSGLVETEEITASGTITAELEKTGIYTLVGVSCDASGASQKHGAVTFGYLKAGEEKPVVLTVRTELTWEYEKELGATPENSIKGIVWGEDIKSAKYGLIKTSLIENMTQAQLETLMTTGGNPVSAANLAKINGNGWAPFFTGQEKGTSYTLMVWADNGYNGKLFMAEQTTAGKADPMQRKYTFDDLFLFNDKADLFKTWNLWAIDLFDEENTDRQLLGTVTFSENTEADEPDVDAVNVKGLTLGDIAEDTVVWEYYNGVVYTLGAQPFGSLTIQNQTIYLSYAIIDAATGQGTTGDYAMVGGLTEDGYLAFVGNENTLNAMWIRCFTDANYTQPFGNGNWNIYYDLLLVDPADVSNVSAKPKIRTSQEQLQSLQQALSSEPTNYVELRGYERAHALIDEMRNRSVFRFTTLEGEVSTQAVTPVKSTYSNVIVRPVGNGMSYSGTLRKM